ncbi:hypothetical protein MUA24_14515 (plasmid) [Staphylococcus aureus]|nr:hypothetical protein [Staphylococcus aureus]UXV49014.1 hypothetical protein MUA24_14515 [Staphylococcus aureus]
MNLEEISEKYHKMFGEYPPLMFLRGMTQKEKIEAIEERIKEKKDFAELYDEQDWLS